MKGVTIEGVEYLAAAALAKQFRYTTDYIGQLCRAKKVDAKLVGRTWYVNPLSLTKHKTARYKKVITAEKIPEISKEITLSRTDVDPQIFVSRNQRPIATQQPHFVRRIDWKPLKYETDEVELLPKMSRPKEISHEIRLNLAESTSLSVKNNSKDTKLVADELPAVSLNGKLRIESLNDPFADVVETTIPEMVLNEPEIVVENMTIPTKIPNLSPINPVRRKHGIHSPVSLIPTNLSRLKTSVSTVSSTVSATDTQSGRTAEVILVVSTTILAGFLFMLLFGELNLVAQPGFYKWEIVFSTQSLPALVSLFSQ